MLSFDSWDHLLRQYVDPQGRVDYTNWQANAAQTLKDCLNQWSNLDLSQYRDVNQQLAFWLNLYNALVIDQVLARYPLASIRPVIFGIPNWIAFFRFFQRKIYQIGDQKYSLNDIEHGIIRPQFRDPRIHFALVCAAVGCPLLRNEAYQPEYVQTQLDDDAHRFINNPDKVCDQVSVLYCSRIFQWYKKDFLNISASVPEYIQKYLVTELPNPSKMKVRYLNYDWSLNQRTSS